MIFCLYRQCIIISDGIISKIAIHKLYNIQYIQTQYKNKLYIHKCNANIIYIYNS